MTIDVEKFIREAAGKGWSKLMTREALGIRSVKFEQILTAIPDVAWPAPGTSVRCREWQARRAIDRTDLDRKDGARGGRKSSERHMREAFGMKSTIVGFAAQFGLGRELLRRRVHSTGSMEKALRMCGVQPKKVEQ